MAKMARLSELDLAQLEQLHERALTHRALEWAATEALRERDELIASVMQRAEFAGARVAEAALIGPSWPSKIRDYHATRLAEWRVKHPSRIEILREARERLDLMISMAEGEQ